MGVHPASECWSRKAHDVTTADDPGDPKATGAMPLSGKDRYLVDALQLDYCGTAERAYELLNGNFADHPRVKVEPVCVCVCVCVWLRRSRSRLMLGRQHAGLVWTAPKTGSGRRMAIPTEPAKRSQRKR